MLTQKKIALIGLGKLGETLVRALLDARAGGHFVLDSFTGSA